MPDSWKELKKQAREEMEEGRLLFRRAKPGLSKQEQEQAKSLFKSIDSGLRKKDASGLKISLEEYRAFKQKHFAHIRINKTWETVKELFWIVLIVFLIRWLFIEPFRIPSGSMIPTLLVGDQLMVNKLIYGVQIPFTTRKLFNLTRPRRGDVIVFKFPQNPREDYVKRVVGVAGDEVMVRDGKLFINGSESPREFIGEYTGPSDSGSCPEYDLFREELDHKEHQMLLCHRSHIGDDFGPVKIPEGAVFGMGDNRDNSADSRVWGFVPLNNIKGKAMFIHLPLDPMNHYLPRWNRFFKWIR